MTFMALSAPWLGSVRGVCLVGHRSLLTRAGLGGSREHVVSAQAIGHRSLLTRSGLHAFRGRDQVVNRETFSQVVTRRSLSQITEEGLGTHKPSAFQKKTLVWAKMYPSVAKVPERVTRTQLKIAMDKFRIRASLFMVAGTFILAAVYALVGRKQRLEGRTVTHMRTESKN